MIQASKRWELDPDGDVVVKDEQDAVDDDGVLIAVDNTLLHSRVTWRDPDLQETKRQSVVSEAGPEPGDRCGVTQARSCGSRSHRGRVGEGPCVCKGRG